MTDLKAAAQQALEALEYGQDTLKQTGENQWESRGQLAMDALRAALAEQLTDEQISDLWHQSGEQPFKFARMLVK